MAELADAEDLKSSAAKAAWEFESPSRHSEHLAVHGVSARTRDEPSCRTRCAAWRVARFDHVLTTFFAAQPQRICTPPRVEKSATLVEFQTTDHDVTTC